MRNSHAVPVFLILCAPLVAQSNLLQAIPATAHGIPDQTLRGRASSSAGERGVLVDSTDKIFPHLAIGGSWDTTIVLVNLGTTTISFSQYFFDQTGTSMPVTFKSVPDGQITTSTGIGGTIGPATTVNLVLSDPGTAVKVGWSVLDYDSTATRLGGYAIFRQRVAGRPDFEALVPLSSYADEAFVMPFDNLNGFATTIAILNPGANLASTVTAHIRDSNGVLLGSPQTITLGPGAQTAFSIPERFPASRDQVGSIYFEGTTNRLSALGFRFNPGGAFATIPIMNWVP